MGPIGSNKRTRGIIILHYAILCALVCASSTAGIRVSIPHRQNERLKITIPITLRIEAPPNFQPELPPFRNVSAEGTTLPVSVGYNSTAVPLQFNIPSSLPQFLEAEKLQDFEAALKQRLKNEELIIPEEVILEDEDYTGLQGTKPEPEVENEANITAHLLTEDGKLKLFIAPAAMQAATKLFTYALGMNMTANKGRKPICDCGKRRLDGVYPYVERNLKNSNSDRSSQRISGGAEAIPNEFPWRVGLQGSPNGVFCGGSIIDNGWVVTAAHCLHDLDPNTVIYVNAGDHDITTVTETDNVVIRASGWTIHPDYNPYTKDNNIALIRLQRDLVYRDNIQPICLPYKLVDDDFTGATAVTGGWGSRTEAGPPSKVLRRVDLPVLSAHQICDFTREIVTDNMIGTMMAGRDTCSGDLGGTLDFFDLESGRYQAIGIASHGDGCARVNSPRIYTKMTNYLDYIHETTKAAFCVK